MNPVSNATVKGGLGDSAARNGAGARWIEPEPGLVRIRLSRVLVEEMKTDLRRPHPFAAERVGFLSVATGRGEGGELLVLGLEYLPVKEDHYVEDPTVGVKIGVGAIRGAIDRVRLSRRGLFHVHLHEHRGVPRFSSTDRHEQPRLVESLRRVGGRVPHGMVVLSDDSATAWVWLPGEPQPVRPRSITIVGYPMTFITSEVIAPSRATGNAEEAGRFSRQSFLGSEAQSTIERVRIGIVGLGGGGSHCLQQVAHIGFEHIRGFDGDVADQTSLNRLVGVRAKDAACGRPKTEIAERLVRGLLPDADIVMYRGRWQDSPELLRGCDVVIGCVDTFAGRRELEVACRRYLIPYVDIGMDVNQAGDDPPRMAGQVILSMPGGHCLFCLGFLTEERLAQEAARYGAAGGRPQVVWPNGVLASTAIGVVMDLVTGWTRQQDRVVYMSYDGNTGEVKSHVRLRYLHIRSCSHYGAVDVGDPVLCRVTV
jgi:hypothetical protein